jgi:hypothetical protein
MTYRFLTYDILTTLKKLGDDKDISLQQVLYWIQVVVNKHRFIEAQTKPSGSFTSTFSPVTVSKDTSFEDNRKYIDLPAQIMDLKNEAGVNYITYNIDTGCCCGGSNFTQVFFQPTTVNRAFRLYMDEYEKPTPDNPYFYRIGQEVNNVKVDRLYLLGVECINLSDVEVSLQTSLDPAAVCDLDEQVPIGDEFIHQVILEVLQLGRFALLIPEERINEGSDLAKTTQASASPTTKTTVEETETE